MYFITGGLGLIGRWLTKILLDTGERVTTFSRSSGEKAEEAFGERKKNWTHVRGNLDSITDVMQALKISKAKSIFHIGGMLSIPSENNPQACFNTNTVGMFNILESARLFDIEQVIYASSNGTYGLGLDGLSRIDDDTVQRPTTIYGCTKVYGELLGRYYRKKYNLDFRGLRIPAVVGPGSKTKHVSIYNAWAVEKSLLGEPYEIFVTPETKCPFIYFKDAAEAFQKLAAVPAERIKTVNYNIAGIKPIPTAEELKNAICRHVPGARLSFKPETLAMEYQKMHQKIIWDESRAAEEWDWGSRFGIDDMIVDFEKEIKEHASWYD
ncbi:MAG: NAD-dependent epimerase/dehydratase family protein [Spirochaetales bacterium]|nr:MAG: NAD-dependent epimerase/dehydratase family protein [Spirochaetales bacterium]